MHTDDISVSVTVQNHELDEQQQRVVDTYEQNIETFIRKNEDYGGSFEDSAKVESILKHGEVREDEMAEIVSRQIFVRGFMDKVSRFYQLALNDEEQMVADEDVVDTLLDLGNYAIMLASLLTKYESDDYRTQGAEELNIDSVTTESTMMRDGPSTMAESLQNTMENDEDLGRE